VRRIDLSTLGTGIAVLVLGVFLLLHANGKLDLGTGESFAVVGGCVLVALIARAMARPPAPAAETGERDTLPIPPALSPETTRASKLGLTVGGLLGVGLIVLWLTGAIEFAGRVALAALVVAIALILISAPFWRAIFNRLGAERVARARADERADVAAHLHDSVLQTLALIQKRSDDPEQVGRLARRQERELREWLSDTEPSRPDERLADALRATAADIEDSHGTPIEAVVVGDAELDERLEALVAASREALTNSAKFASDGGPVRLYAEIERGSARVFIDDRGPGFDADSIPAERRGVRESIIGRMERYGGKAEIRSAPDDGTEVELTMRAARR
jgi:two-component sensor histidine kinase